MSEPGPYERFAIIRVGSNGSLNGLNVMAQGSWPDVIQHIPDNRVVKEKLKILNDAAVTERKLDAKRAALREERADLEARADAFATDVEAVRDVLIQEFVGKLDDLSRRMDAIETTRDLAKYDEPITVPPGIEIEPVASGRAGRNADEGELTAVKEAPTDPDDPDNPDFDEDLPRSPVAVEDQP